VRQLNEVARTRLKGAKSRTVLALLVLVTLGAGSFAWTNANASETTPAAGTRAAEDLGLNALRQLCTRKGLVTPRVGKRTQIGEKNIVVNRGYSDQEWFLYEDYPLVPAVCNGKYKRISQVRPQVQNPYNHRRWIDSTRPRWILSTHYNLGFGDPSDPNFIDEGRTHVQVLLSSGKRGLYKCTPGRGVTRVRFVERRSVRNVKTGRIIAQRSKAFPVRVFAGTYC